MLLNNLPDEPQNMQVTKVTTIRKEYSVGFTLKAAKHLLKITKILRINSLKTELMLLKP